MQRRVLEKDIFYQSLIYLGIDNIARFHDIVQGHSTFNDNQCPHMALSHTHARQHNGYNGFLILLTLFIAIGEKPGEGLEALVRTQLIQKNDESLPETG